jgi:hypothetical protein
MSEKHSAVCYIFREGAFSPVREAWTCFSTRVPSMRAGRACNSVP